MKKVFQENFFTIFFFLDVPVDLLQNKCNCILQSIKDIF